MRRSANRRIKPTFSFRGIMVCLAVGMLFLVHTPGSARGAGKYPASAVDIICPFAAGAATDYLARFMAEELSKKWGQPVNVVNKTGGNTVIGTHAMMTAAPDGYTLFADSIGSSSSQVGLKSLPYDPMKRTFLARTFIVPQVVVVSMNSPWQSLKEMAEAGKKDPTCIVWGTMAGGRGGGDLVQLQFFEAAGINVPKARRVDFTGVATAVNALAGDHIKLSAGSPAAVFPAVSGGKAKALAVTTPKRTPLIPDCPTTKEAGFPSVNYVYWVGFSGPPALPAQVIETFTKTAEEILKGPDVADRLAKKFDAVPTFLPTDSFRQFIQDEASKINRLQGLMSGGK